MAARTLLRIDAGTARIRVMMPRKGLVLDEPNVCIYNQREQSYTHVGSSALAKSHRLNRNEQLIWGFKHGVIADYEATKAIVTFALRQVLPRVLLVKPDAIVTLAGAANSTERKAWLDALQDCGVRQSYILPSAYAAALGSGIALTEPHGSMMFHLGAGTMEVAIFSLGEIIHSASLRIGGDDLDDALQQRIQRLYGVTIPVHEARKFKESRLRILAEKPVPAIQLKGLLVNKGTTKKINAKNEEIVPAFENFIEPLIRATKHIIDQASPELISDIIEDGVLISGGLANIPGLARYLSKKLKLSCVVSDEPVLAPIRGLNLAATHVADFQRQEL